MFSKFRFGAETVSEIDNVTWSAVSRTGAEEACQELELILPKVGRQ